MYSIIHNLHTMSKSSNIELYKICPMIDMISAVNGYFGDFDSGYVPIYCHLATSKTFIACIYWTGIDVNPNSVCFFMYSIYRLKTTLTANQIYKNQSLYTIFIYDLKSMPADCNKYFSKINFKKIFKNKENDKFIKYENVIINLVNKI